MRKLLAVVLTVLMLTSVLAVFPASAAETNNTPILITEIMVNYSNKLTDGVTAAGDNTEHMEIYNTSDAPVNIYNLSLAQAPYYKSEPAATDLFYDYWNMWVTEKAFFAKNDIKQGSIMFEGEEDLAEGFLLQNDIDDAELAPGEIAVIWFVRESTVAALQDYAEFHGIEDIATWDVREYFIDLYTTDSYTVDDNVKIYLMWSGGTNSDASTGLPLRDRVYGDDCNSNRGYMYGLVSDSLELDTCVYDAQGNLSSDVYALAGFGGGAKNFAVTKSARSHIYVPSNTTPDYYNALLKYRESKDAIEGGYADYLAAGCVPSYDVAAILETNVPCTPGTLTAMQWAYIDPAKAPADVTGNDPEWTAAYIKAYLEETFPDLSNLEDANTETEIEIDPPTQEELNAIFYPKPPKKNNTTKKGLGTGAIIGIVAGGVVVAAAAAAAVVIVVKKKKAA